MTLGRSTGKTHRNTFFSKKLRPALLFLLLLSILGQFLEVLGTFEIVPFITLTGWRLTAVTLLLFHGLLLSSVGIYWFIVDQSFVKRPYEKQSWSYDQCEQS
jgi:hypothetical protein